MTLSGSKLKTTVKQDDLQPRAKPFEIPKRLVWESWKRVAANKGAPGVDKESIQVFQSKLGRNLYTLWNRMSSGSYFPQPVRQVLIPKSDGQSRSLGIPTVNDRVAQMVVKKDIGTEAGSCFSSVIIWLSSWAQCPSGGGSSAA